MSKIYKGIDISLYQGEPNFATIRDAGVDFVIFKASQGRAPNYPYFFADPKFKINVPRFAATPGKFYGGSYHYLMVTSVYDAEKEAKQFIDVIKPYRFNLQLWAAVDVEDSSLTVNKAQLTAIVKKFCDVVKEAGFRPLVYSSTWWFNNRFTAPAGVPVWEANWSISSIPSRARMWQCGARNVAGFPTAVDYNYAYDIMGDGNGDGKVNSADVLAAMRHIIKKNPKINESQLDFDRDGKVTSKDVRALMKAIV